MGVINITHYKLKENLKIENGKNIEHKIMKPKFQCQQNKTDAQNDKIPLTIEVMNAIYAEVLYAETKFLEKTVNFTDYVKLKEQNCFCVQQNLIWMQFSPKYQSLINLMIYLQLSFVLSHLLSVNFLPLKGVLTRQRCLKERRHLFEAFMVSYNYVTVFF